MDKILYAKTLSLMHTVKDLNAASALLGWDQETYMPEGAAVARSEQMSTLDAIAHEKLTDDSSSKIANQVRSFISDNESNDYETRLLKLFLKEYDRAVRLPAELVRETSKACSLAHDAWKKARAVSDFTLFAPHLKHLVELKTQAAELYGYSGNRYDALLDIYEPGLSVDQLRPIFTRLRSESKILLNRIQPVIDAANNTVLFKSYNRDKQLQFARFISEKIGFNFGTGRVDLSTHPFCTSFAPSDVRLTTRIFDNDIRSCLFGLIHETGHGLYEQGFDPNLARTFGSDGSSMGIHESQSLFWENVVARSEEFWQWALPLMKDYFPEQLSGITPFDFYKAINVIEPSLIRIEADELTYNLHIILRFEIEEALINGTMQVDDVPQVWYEKMRDYLGISPPSDAQGCLQDIHWSFGGFGYFPSYTLGKLYAAMLRKVLLKDLPNLSEEIRRGNFHNTLEWLREKIHRHGKIIEPAELILNITGNPLSEQDFLEYVQAKAERVYGL